jgi:hypothetical protein
MFAVRTEHRENRVDIPTRTAFYRITAKVMKNPSFVVKSLHNVTIYIYTLSVESFPVESFPFWSLVERVLTGKLFTSKLPTGKFSTDKAE